jgi:transcriptional regulator with XRE-family HTH domain
MGRKRKPIDTTRYAGRLAARMVQLREKRGLTPEEVAEKMSGYKKDGFEISANAYRHWESGLRQVNWNAIPAICKAIKAKPRDLIPEK